MMNGKDRKDILRMFRAGEQEFRRVNREQRERFEKAMCAWREHRKQRTELLRQLLESL